MYSGTNGDYAGYLPEEREVVFMARDKEIKKKGKKEMKGEKLETNAHCCYVADPCGCYVDPCGCYVDPCCW
jgi:hypothetical protein